MITPTFDIVLAEVFLFLKIGKKKSVLMDSHISLHVAENVSYSNQQEQSCDHC